MDYKHLLESILIHLEEGIIVVDRNANITFYNEPASNIAGIEPEKAIGKNILDVFPDLTPETSTFYYVLRTKKPLIDYIQTYTNFSGKKVSIVTSTIPLKKNGDVIGAIEIYRDLTYVKELSDKIVSLQEKLFKTSSTQKVFRENGAYYTFKDIIGKSRVIKDLVAKAKKISNSSSPVLVYGETGTGKELLVQAIHNASATRRNKPFIAQNCAALPRSLLEGILFGTTSGSFTGARDKPGLFELANGGTLYLDEINSMDLELQPKLLRVLQDGMIRRIGGVKTRVVDVRIIASTNEDPLKAVKKKLLREDLFYRLNVFSLRVPPLRERKDDIPLLIDHFITMFNKKLNKRVKGVSPKVLEVFLEYHWPGNVRELKSSIENIMNLTEKDVIELDDLPPNISSYFSSARKQQPDENNLSLPPLKQALCNYEIWLCS